MNLKVGQLIWIMYNNQPRQIIVSKIIDSVELRVVSEEPIEGKVVSASFSKNYNHEFNVNIDEAFETKEELMLFVFKDK